MLKQMKVSIEAPFKCPDDDFFRLQRPSPSSSISPDVNNKDQSPGQPGRPTAESGPLRSYRSSQVGEQCERVVKALSKRSFLKREKLKDMNFLQTLTLALPTRLLQTRPSNTWKDNSAHADESKDEIIFPYKIRKKRRGNL